MTFVRWLLWLIWPTKPPYETRAASITIYRSRERRARDRRA